MNDYKFIAIAVVFLFVAIVSSFVMLIRSAPEPPLRTVTLYDNSGKVIKEYSGKVRDVTRNSGGVKFWLDG